MTKVNIIDVLGEHPKNYLVPEEVMKNLLDLVLRVNLFLEYIEEETYNYSVGNELHVQTLLQNLEITSGWRPEPYNKKIGGAKRSRHIIGKAIDLKDSLDLIGSHGVLADFIQNSPTIFKLLNTLDLAIESPRYTLVRGSSGFTSWLHIQRGAPKSENRIFIPYSNNPPLTDEQYQEAKKR